MDWRPCWAARWGPAFMAHAAKSGGDPKGVDAGSAAAFAAQNTSDFYLAQASLPVGAAAKTEPGVAAYQAFIRRYGTHYMQSALYGGVAEVLVSVDASFVAKISFEVCSWADEISDSSEKADCEAYRGFDNSLCIFDSETTNDMDTSRAQCILLVTQF